MSKIMPKKYGDRVTHAGDAENPLMMVPILNVYVTESGADDRPAPAPKTINGTKLNGN